MSAIRLNRGVQLDRAGELLEELSPVNEQVETPPIEAVSRLQQQRFQDGFDNLDKRPQDGIDTVGKRPLVNLSGFDNLLISADFKEHLQETLEGTSARAQHAKQVESTYEAFFKDTQDFSVRNESGPSLTVPEAPLRYEAPAETAWKGRAMTVPEFQVSVDDLPAAAHVQQAAQAEATLLEARRTAQVAEQPFRLLGRATIRA